MFGFTEDEFCAMSADYWPGTPPGGRAGLGTDESYVGTPAKDFAAMFGMTEDEFCSTAPSYCRRRHADRSDHLRQARGHAGGAYAHRQG